MDEEYFGYIIKVSHSFQDLLRSRDTVEQCCHFGDFSAYSSKSECQSVKENQKFARVTSEFYCQIQQESFRALTICWWIFQVVLVDFEKCNWQHSFTGRCIKSYQFHLLSKIITRYMMRASFDGNNNNKKGFSSQVFYMFLFYLHQPGT